MSWHSEILRRFRNVPTATETTPLLLLDMTLWHQWHHSRGTLPADFGPTLPDAYRALGTAVWAPFRPWRVAYEGVDVTTEKTAEAHDIRYRVQGRTLLARWTRGPDGDWWQEEYPVKSLDDLRLAVEIAASRRYVINTEGLDAWRASVGEDGVVPLELPMQPYSDLLHTLVGWGEGLLLMRGAGKDLVNTIIAELEAKLRALVPQIAALPGDLLLAADNLDGQYISPRIFGEHLAQSYAATAASAHESGKHLVVHIGGPGRRLAPLLAEAGVDAIQGVSGPPQGDATLTEARESCGPEVVLWGGVPQDLLSMAREYEMFERSVREVVDVAAGDSRVILGVADRVPPQAELERLKALVQATRIAQE